MRAPDVLILFKAFFAGANLGSISPFPASGGKGRRSFLRAAGKGLGRLGFALLMVVGFGGLMASLGGAYLAVETIGRTLLGREALGVVAASAMAFVFVLMLGFLSGADILYKGKDMELLRSLPVADASLLLSRMLVLAVLLLPYHIGIVLPALVVRFVAGPFTLACATGALLLLLVTPLLASALACLLTGLVCRLGGKGASRAAGQIAIVVLMLALVSFMRFGDPAATDALQALVLAMEKLCRFLPLFAVFAGTLGGPGALADSIITLAVCVGVFVLAGAILSRSFQKVAANLEGRGGRRRRRAPSGRKAAAPEAADRVSVGTSVGDKAGARVRAGAKAPRSRPPVLALAAREWDIILGSSVFAVEIAAQALAPLIVIVVWAMLGVLGTMESSLAPIKGLWFFPAAVCGIIMLFQGIGAVSATSVSREGPLAAVSRTYPLAWRDFVGAKLLVHLTVVWAPSLVYTALASWILGLGAWSVLGMGAAGLAFSVAIGLEGLALDYRHPRLEWQNPQQAIKQNPNSLKSMGLALVQILLLGALLAAGNALAGPWAGWALMALGLAALVALAVLWVRPAAERFYAPQGAVC